MKVLKAWAEALGIDHGTLNAWMSDAPKHESLTFWCLERGHLRSSDYFAWAMEYYGLAMIREDYFALPANRDLWTKIQSVANWGPEMLPLEEWDGTVFVACVEPAEDIQWSFPVQYVLATTRDLQTQWERLHSESTVVAPAPKPLAPPVKLNDEKSTFNIPILNLPDMANNQATVDPKPEIPPPVTAIDDAPVGLSAIPSTTSFKLNLGSNDLLEPTAKAITAVDTLAPSVTNLAIPISAPKKTTMGHGSIDSDSQAPTSLEAAKSEIEAIAFVFQQLKQNFKYSWLFIVSPDFLTPYCWDSAVKPTSPHAQDPIDLTQPSLFRIVIRTRMPYHGHVVESPINTGFFRAWGLRNTPPHVTAIPLSSAGQTVALLLCAGEKPVQQDQSLRFTEKMGNVILSNLGKKQAA